MDQPLRLFDIIAYQQQRYPLQQALNAKLDGQWKSWATDAIADFVNRLSAGLLSLGIHGHTLEPETSSKIAIMAPNCPEWVMLDLAAQQIGVPLIPIYPTTNPLEITFVFNDAEVKHAFAGTHALYDKLKAVQQDIPTLEEIWLLAKESGSIPHMHQLADRATPALLEEVERWKSRIRPDTLATIIYTSGTTGTPKGVMLSHGNILSNVLLASASFPFGHQPGQRTLSFLPLNHIFERTITYIYLLQGASIYYAEGLETIAANLLEVRPHGFTTVPRLLEKVYEGIQKKAGNLHGWKRWLFDWAVDIGFQYDPQKKASPWYRMQLSLANKLIFSRWRAGLGGHLEFIITGGAACQPRLLRIFNAAGIPTFEGYGPTENSPVICVNRRTPGGMFIGTVGPPLDGQEVTLAEDGEVLVKGPSVMQGYYKRADLTAETIKDGWLLTGDIGVWEQTSVHRFLKITDRKKELFKTSGGKYVAPQPIENRLKEIDLIEQAMVIGAERKFVSALIVVNEPALQDWYRQQKKDWPGLADALSDAAVQKLYRGLVETANRQFNQVEQVKKFELLPNVWSVETGELTPKLSLKRKIIMEKCKAVIERMYD